MALPGDRHALHRAFGVRYIEHDIPERVARGAVLAVRLVVENTGQNAWPSKPRDGRSVDIGVFCAGKVIDTWKTSRGVVWPGERVLIHAFRFNDPADFLRLFEQHRKDLAGVMLEPSGPWAGIEAGHAPDPEPGFLQLLRDKTHEAGALLVFDEIMTGYRNPQGSVQKAQGVTPDLTCLGKALVLAEPDPQHRLLMRTLLQQELLRRGVAVFTQGVMLPCYAHDDATLARTLGAFDEAFAIVAQAKQRGTLERQIVIPPLVDT